MRGGCLKGVGEATTETVLQLLADHDITAFRNEDFRRLFRFRPMSAQARLNALVRKEPVVAALDKAEASLDLERLERYAVRMDVPSLCSRLGCVLEMLGEEPKSLLRHASPEPVKLNARGPRRPAVARDRQPLIDDLGRCPGRHGGGGVLRAFARRRHSAFRAARPSPHAVANNMIPLSEHRGKIGPIILRLPPATTSSSLQGWGEELRT